MAGFNPYARRDDGEGILTRAVRAPYRVGRYALASSPTWAPRVAAGQGVRKLQGAYASAYEAVRNYDRTRALAIGRSKVAGNRIAANNARDLASARSAVSRARLASRVAYSRVQSTFELAKGAEAEAREAYRTAVTPKGKASIQERKWLKANADFDFARGRKGVVNSPLAKAGQDYQTGRDMLAGALRDQRRASAATRAAEKRVSAVVDEGARRLVAGKKAAYDQVMAWAKPVTGGQRKLYQAGEAVKSAVGAVRTAADTAKGVVGRAVSAVNPFASKAEFAARLAGSKTAKTGAGVAKVIGRAGRKAAGGVGKTVGLLAKAPVKTIAGTFNTIEKAGRLVAGTGKAANMLRAATSASGLAGGFAFGAWTDAALKAYEFYANGGKLSDLGGSRITTINGKLVRENNPGLGDVFFSREYAKEALKGIQSALTFGLTGNGDDTYLDRAFDQSPEEEAERLNAQLALNDMLMTDVHGNAVYSEEELKARAQALDAASAQSKAAQKFAARARGDLNVQNFRSMLGDITNQRKTALDSMEANIRNFADFSKTLRRPMTEEAYRASATAKANSDYDRRMAMLLGNKAAQDVMKENRRAAYATYGVGSGDYDADVVSATGDRLNELREFNRMWEEQSDAEKVAWTKEDAEKAMSEVAAAYKPEEVE